MTVYEEYKNAYANWIRYGQSAAYSTVLIKSLARLTEDLVSAQSRCRYLIDQLRLLFERRAAIYQALDNRVILPTDLEKLTASQIQFNRENPSISTQVTGFLSELASKANGMSSYGYAVMQKNRDLVTQDKYFEMQHKNLTHLWSDLVATTETMQSNPDDEEVKHRYEVTRNVIVAVLKNIAHAISSMGKFNDFAKPFFELQNVLNQAVDAATNTTQMDLFDTAKPISEHAIKLADAKIRTALGV